MFRLMAAALLFLLVQTTVASAAPSCAGADPAITGVAVQSVNTVGGLNHYHISGTVTNLGASAQATNVLQFVDIYQGHQKLDDRGIPPLKPGQSYTFGYVSLRSRQAGKGTTTLTFRLDMRQPSGGGQEDCNTSNDRGSVTF